VDEEDQQVTVTVEDDGGFKGDKEWERSARTNLENWSHYLKKISCYAHRE